MSFDAETKKKQEMIASSFDTAPVYARSLLSFLVLGHYGEKNLWLKIRKSKPNQCLDEIAEAPYSTSLCFVIF